MRRNSAKSIAPSIKDEDGVLVLVPSDLISWEQTLLDYRYESFPKEEPVPMSSFASELTGWMWTEVGHVPAWGASIMMSSLDAEKVQLSTIKEESTEQIANRIVKLGSKGIWMLKPNTANPKGPADEQIDITLTTTTPDFLPASPAIPENPPPKKSRAASLSPRLPFFAPSMSYPRSYDMNYRSISR